MLPGQPINTIALQHQHRASPPRVRCRKQAAYHVSSTRLRPRRLPALPRETRMLAHRHPLTPQTLSDPDPLGTLVQTPACTGVCPTEDAVSNLQPCTLRKPFASSLADRKLRLLHTRAALCTIHTALGRRRRHAFSTRSFLLACFASNSPSFDLPYLLRVTMLLYRATRKVMLGSAGRPCRWCSGRMLHRLTAVACLPTP